MTSKVIATYYERVKRSHFHQNENETIVQISDLMRQSATLIFYNKHSNDSGYSFSVWHFRFCANLTTEQINCPHNNGKNTEHMNCVVVQRASVGNVFVAISLSTLV